MDWLFVVSVMLEYRDVTIADEELQILGLCCAPAVFELGGIFIVPYLL